jgi:hypothetical protein
MNMRNKRTLVPRARESVNRQLESDNDSSQPYSRKGDLCINPGLKNVRHVKPDCYKKGKTVIRIWPMLDPEDPSSQLLDGRLNTQGVAGLGGMSISEPAYCVAYAGITADHGFLSDPKDAAPCSYIIARNKSSVVEGVTFWDEPYVKLQVVAKRAMLAGEFGEGKAWDAKWNKLMPPVNKPAISPFKQCHFVVCSVYENGTRLDLIREHEEYTAAGKQVVKDHPRNGIPLGEAPLDPLIVMQMSVTAGRNILKLACEEKKDWKGDPHTNPSIMFTYGDPTGRFDARTGTVRGGRFFTIYNPDVCKDEFQYTTYSGSLPANGFPGYEAAISTKYAGPNGVLTPDLTAEQVDNILNKHVFLWKDSPSDPADSYLLHEPTIEERCVLIAKAFKPVSKLVEFCWMSNPEYLNFDEVRGILRQRKSVLIAKPEMEDEDEMEEEELAPPKAKVAAKVKPVAPVAPAKKSAAELVDEFDDEELDEDEFDDELEDDDDDDMEEIAPPVKAKAPAKASAKAPAKAPAKKAPVKPVKDEFDDELDDDELEEEDELEDDAEIEDDEVAEEEDTESADFDSFDDEVDNSELEEQLNNSLSKAKAIARSRKRTAAPEPEPAAKPPLRKRAK